MAFARVPRRCLEKRPTPQSVEFAGRFINLTRLRFCFDPPLDHSYLSRIFRGARAPTTEYSRQIAAALGMKLAPFLDALQLLQTEAQQERKSA